MKLSKTFKKARLPMTVRIFLTFAAYFGLMVHTNDASTMWYLLLLISSFISLFEGIS